MKSTKVQTLGELHMRDTANWWAGHAFTRGLPLSSWRVWHGLATVVDNMREQGTWYMEQADPIEVSLC